MNKTKNDENDDLSLEMGNILPKDLFSFFNTKIVIK